MENSSLPMILYLNDGNTDKTGFEKLKHRAFAKAFSYYPSESNVTLGPGAVHKEKPNELSTIKDSNGQSSCFPNNLTPLQSRNRTLRNTAASHKYVSSESPEKKEEKFTRKRILASLENMCLLESQEKVNEMRREWMKREEETFSHMQDELDQETQAMVERRMKQLSSDNSVVFEMKLPEDNELRVPTETKDQTTPNHQYSNTSLQEVNKRKEFLAEISSQHSKLLYISNEVSKCLKFDDAKFRNSIASELDFLKKASQEFSRLIENCEQKTLSPEELNTARAIVSEANKIYTSIKTKEEKRKIEIEEERKKISEEKKKMEEEKERKLKEEENQRKQKEEVNTDMDEDVHLEENVLSTNSETNKELNLPDPETTRIQSVMAHYKKYFKVLNSVTSELKDFMANDSLKKFRSECQKAVNVPVNAISAVSAAHLNDKWKKLYSLLSGQQVLINSKPFNPTQHPLGVTYCTYLLAEKIVRLGEDVVSVKPDAAFPIAVVVLALWGDFPQFGELLMAAFHKVCPYLIPIFWIKEEGMSDDDYYRKLGFKFQDGEREDINKFLKREGGVVSLYFSIVISHMKDKSKAHPLDLNEAWRWLAMFTSLEPSAEITATLLFVMLDVTGYALKKTYGKQFFKLIHLICVQYLPKIEKATPAGKGGPVSRLKSFLEELIRTQSVKPPKGLLPSNFW